MSFYPLYSVSVLKGKMTVTCRSEKKKKGKEKKPLKAEKINLKKMRRKNVLVSGKAKALTVCMENSSSTTATTIALYAT
jgi:hypothetical protein